MKPWAGSDIHPLLDPGQDKVFWQALDTHIDSMLGPMERPLTEALANIDDLEAGGAAATNFVAVKGWAGQLDTWLADNAAQLDPRTVAELGRSLKGLKRRLETVSGDTPENRAVRIALLPVSVPLLGAVAALPVFAGEPTSALLMQASIAKTAVYTIGAVLRAGTDLSTAMHIFVHRHSVNLWEGALMAVTAIPTDDAEKLAHDIKYVAGVAAISFTLGMAMIFGKDLHRKARDAWNGPRLAPGGEATRSAIGVEIGRTQAMLDAVDNFTRAFKAEGRLSNTGNTHQTDLLARIGETRDTLSRMRADSQAATGGRYGITGNRDIAPKSVRLLASGGINGGALAMFIGAAIATTTMSADLAIAMFLLGKEVLDRYANEDSMQDGFQNWVALSALLIPLMAVNKVLERYGLGIAENTTTRIAFNVATPVANLFAPAWIGMGVNALLTKAIGQFRDRNTEGATRTLDALAEAATDLHGQGLADGGAGDDITPEQQAWVARRIQAAIDAADAPQLVDGSGRVVELDELPPLPDVRPVSDFLDQVLGAAVGPQKA